MPRSDKPLKGFTMGQGVDDLGLTVPDAKGRLSASDALDGPAPPVDPAEVAQAQAQNVNGFLSVEARRAAEAKAHGGQQVAHAIYDVSEGTPLDPLLDKTYDLNSPKTVPSLK